MGRTWTEDLLWILLALGLVALNGFFVAAEFALVKVRPTRLAHLAREGRAFARSAQWLSRRLDRSLSACQLGITMASLALGWIGEPAVAHFVAPVFRYLGVTSETALHTASFVIAFTIITAAHLTLGEQTPKIFAIRRPEMLAVWCAAPLRAYYVLTFPLLRALDAATSAILRVLRVGQASDHESPHSQEELLDLVGLARAHGELSSWEHRLVQAAFEFDDKVCRQIMVPRGEIVFLDARAPLRSLLDEIKRSNHTRYPVCEGSLDDVVGIAHVKDLLGASADAGFSLRALARPPKYVPESMMVSRLLSHFRATRQHMALVVDEYGTVVGIVTLENVLEVIVGPMQDEFDTETPDIVPEGMGRFLVKGGTPVEDVAEALDLELTADEVDTLGGLVAFELGRVPQQGDRVQVGRVVMEVVEARRNRAILVRVTSAKDGQLGPGNSGITTGNDD